MHRIHFKAVFPSEKLLKKMLITVYFISLFSNSLAVFKCQTPCSGFFRYAIDNVTKEVFGRIEIPFPPKNVAIQIRVNLTIATVLPTEYVGKIELAKSQHESVKSIETGEPLLYNIFFPLQCPVPLLTGISFNKYQYCIGPSVKTPVVTKILLEHTLYPPGVDRGLNPVSHLPDNNHKPQKCPINHGDVESLDNFDEMTPSSSLPTTGDPHPMDSLFDSIQLNSHQNENCGKPSGVDHSMPNESQTFPGQWPWLVAIFVARRKFEYRCSGNLITNEHILTAAHCRTVDGYEIPPNLLLISLGRYRLDDWHERGAVTHEVREIIIHPEYSNTSSAHGDLAILVLKKSVQMNWRIKPVCLWSGPIGLEKVVGRMGYVVGWGKDENGNQHMGGPRQKLVPIVSQEDCRNNFKSVRAGPTITIKTFCAGWRNGTGPSNGDSGSGLIIHDQTTDRYYLRGILSFFLLDENMRSCDLSSYVVYADTAKFLNWIHAQISNKR